MRSKFPSAVPEMPVSDINAAYDYYQRSLGFDLDWSDDELGLAGISRGDCRMFLASGEFRKGYDNTGPTVIWLNLQSEADVDELYREYSERGAKLMSAPDRKPWGLYEFTAADPDRNIFRVFYDFATPEREQDADKDAKS